MNVLVYASEETLITNTLNHFVSDWFNIIRPCMCIYKHYITP